MPRRFDRFLGSAPLRPQGATLGRVFGVTQETWRLTDDPMVTEPRCDPLASGRTAADAADLARRAAAAFAEHGFHKPSGAWWGADATHFHRFVVHVGRRSSRRSRVRLGSALAGVFALVAVGLLRARARRAAEP